MVIPHQVGIIVDNIVPQSGVMTWNYIAPLAYFYLLDSILDGINRWVRAYMKASADFRLSALAFTHINKSIDQAKSLSTLVDEILFSVIPMLLDVAIAIGYIVYIFGVYTLLIVVYFMYCYMKVGRLSIVWANSKRRQWLNNSRKEAHTSTESFRLHTTVTMFDQVPYQCAQFKLYAMATMEGFLGFTIRFAVGQCSQDILSDLSLVFGCVLSIWQIVFGSNSIGSFVSFLSYWKNITRPIKRMMASYQTLIVASVDAEKILQTLRTEPSVADHGTEELIAGGGEIKFRNVDFSYNRKATFGTLKDATFTAEPLEKTALVGPTGSGKTTILRLILRLYDANKGSITVDGQELSSVPLSNLREVIGTVPQDPLLFNQFIEDNVRYGRPSATHEEVVEACTAAYIHEKIMSFQDGYQSMVGEGGVRLSGVERQRIAIARVLLMNARIVLLDEATSAVDTITEAHTQQALDKLTSRRTTIVVAHRLSTVAKADKIVVVNDGKIIEQGTHDWLLKQGGKYAKLWGKSQDLANAGQDMFVSDE
ncbi:P-loop containing nucleoside triphosphate hydrolase protein [Lentithecium fluviatile CBS 122367]|uniref:P-loop containing nucleoside triphosphate hydrolase protein n=1 Tax=Lentithecium fluviatile CBS 122367 TaxID=1168545 RepID=A0A6G1JMZ0_9PLEO|nr:P-loop containing nucleoside triphosphate hydrolase protein [Lentithecium fluviatile CBS 122367]